MNVDADVPCQESNYRTANSIVPARPSHSYHYWKQVTGFGIVLLGKETRTKVQSSSFGIDADFDACGIRGNAPKT
jgi:hypothetical protein